MSHVEQRPRHHISVRAGWLNDPNGLSWHEGNYHVFHQFHHAAAKWGTIEWGHLTSPDLVHWTRQPVALSPSPGADAGGCWSGCLIFDGQVPTAVYTGVEDRGPGSWTQTVCLARGDPTLTHFQRDRQSPVLSGAPAGLDTLGFRDPFVWRENGGWAMIVGCGLNGQGGAVLLFRSANLVDWHYEGPIWQRSADELDPIWTGTMWECPQLLPCGDRHLLLFSVWDDQKPPTLHYPVAVIGTFDGRQFVPESLQRLDFGADCYAPAAFQAPDGRILAWGWSWEGLSESARLEQGWAGCLTFPRELSIDNAGGLRITPGRELASLRRDEAVIQSIALGPQPSRLSGPMRGDVLEVQARIEPGDAARVGLALRSSPDGPEETLVEYDCIAQRLEVNRERSSSGGGPIGGVHGGRLALGPDEPLELRVFLDRSIIEIFANDRFVLTERIYPSRSDSTAVAAFAVGGRATLECMWMWQLEAHESVLESGVEGGN